MLIGAVSFVNDLVVAAGSESLVDGLRNFIGPILMLVMGIVAITFLFKREMTQFMIFLGIAIVVAIIFYAPGLITNIAQNVNTSTGNGGEWK